MGSLFQGEDQTTESSSSSTTTSGNINIGQGGLEQILENLTGAFDQSGVAEITPELEAALGAMMGQQGGSGFISDASNMYDQAGNILGNIQGMTPDQLQEQAAGLVNQEMLQNQLGQLNAASQESLGQSLGQIESGASMGGSLGSSRTSLAQGQAIGDSNEALLNAQSNLVSGAYQNAMNQAIQLNQQDINNQLQSAGILSSMAGSQGNLGMGLNHSQINSMLAAGQITQEQANAIKNQGLNKITGILPTLGKLFGTSQTTNSTGSTTIPGQSLLPGMISAAGAAFGNRK